MDRVDYESLVIQDALNLHEKDELDLSPWYQRRPVWSRSQKAYLINTLFVHMPVPSIYIRHYLDTESEKSIKEVVDGQQRLRSIIEYSNDEFRARHPDHKKPVFFSELTANQRSAFRMSKLSVGYLINADDADVIEIFGRLNWMSKRLNDQEKRNAQFGGEFKQFAVLHGTRRVNFWRAYGVFSPNDIARMQEVQFVSDLALNLLNGLTDFSQPKLNKLYASKDLEFPEREKVEKKLERVFAYFGKVKPEVIANSAVSRPPIFFSFFLSLANRKRLPSVVKFKDAIERVDSILEAYSDGERLTKVEERFAAACTSSTQRIKTRQTRQEFIERLLY